MAYALMSAKQISEFGRDLEMNLAIGLQGVRAFFRANVYVGSAAKSPMVNTATSTNVIPNFNDPGPARGTGQPGQCSNARLILVTLNRLGYNRPRWLPCSTNRNSKPSPLHGAGISSASKNPNRVSASTQGVDPSDSARSGLDTHSFACAASMFCVKHQRDQLIELINYVTGLHAA